MRRLHAVAVSGSPSPNSRSRILILHTLSHLHAAGVETSFIDLAEYPADALLGRRQDPIVTVGISKVADATILILGTPIYRATYSGQLKAFFDLFPQDALAGSVVGLVATGAGSGHLLAIDHGLRPLVASLRGLSAAHGVYVTDGQFPDKKDIPIAVDQQTRLLADELHTLATALVPAEALGVAT